MSDPSFPSYNGRSVDIIEFLLKYSGEKLANQLSCISLDFQTSRLILTGPINHGMCTVYGSESEVIYETLL